MIEWLEEHMLPCLFKSHFGVDCPGCGMQRSLISFIKGDYLESFEFYPPLALILILFLTLTLHLIFDFKHGALILKIIFIFSSSSVLINFLHKTFPIF